eukprot:14305712-Alexandrium_andersonii.AAC.1
MPPRPPPWCLAAPPSRWMSRGPYPQGLHPAALQRTCWPRRSGQCCPAGPAGHECRWGLG